MRAMTAFRAADAARSGTSLRLALAARLADWAGTTGIYRGANPAEGAILTYWIKEDTGEPVKIAVEGPGERPVANLTGSSHVGLNRINWDLMPSKDVLTEYGGEGKKFVAPGEYKLTLKYGKAKSEQRLKVEIPAGWRRGEDEAAHPLHGRVAPTQEAGGAPRQLRLIPRTAPSTVTGRQRTASASRSAGIAVERLPPRHHPPAPGGAAIAIEPGIHRIHRDESRGLARSTRPPGRRATSALPAVASATSSPSVSARSPRAEARFESASRAPASGLSLPRPIRTPAARRAATSAVCP
jgi:hypothetical protein